MRVMQGIGVTAKYFYILYSCEQDHVFFSNMSQLGASTISARWILAQISYERNQMYQRLKSS